MTFWTSDPPPPRSRRLQFRDGVASADTPFAASSIGFLPVDSPRAPKQFSRRPIEQGWFPLTRRSTAPIWTASERRAPTWSPTRRPYNADGPVGSRIVATLGGVGFFSSDGPPRQFKQPAQPNNDAASQIFPLEVFGEPVINDLGFTQQVKPIRVGMNADVFPSLGFANTTTDSLFFGSGTTG
jgi:hypothetical protein